MDEVPFIVMLDRSITWEGGTIAPIGELVRRHDLGQCLVSLCCRFSHASCVCVDLMHYETSLTQSRLGRG